MEQKILIWLVEKLKGGEVHVLAKNWVLVMFSLVSVFCIVAMLRFAKNGYFNVLAITTVSMLLGVIVGIVMVYRTSETHWKFILPHLSSSSIEKRLSEIKK